MSYRDGYLGRPTGRKKNLTSYIFRSERPGNALEQSKLSSFSMMRTKGQHLCEVRLHGFLIEDHRSSIMSLTSP